MTPRTERMRDRIQSGEPFNYVELAREAGTTQGYPGMIKKDLRALGYRFEQLELGTYVCTNPQHSPSEADREALRASKRKGPKRKSRARDPKRSAPPLNPESRTAQALARVVPENHSLRQLNGNGILGIPGFERTTPAHDSTPPPFGEGVQVFAMALQDDGTLRLGIQNRDRKWVVDVIAEISRA